MAVRLIAGNDLCTWSLALYEVEVGDLLPHPLPIAAESLLSNCQPSSSWPHSLACPHTLLSPPSNNALTSVQQCSHLRPTMPSLWLQHKVEIVLVQKHTRHDKPLNASKVMSQVSLQSCNSLAPPQLYLTQAPPQLCLTQAPPQLCLTQAPPQLCLSQAPPQLCLTQAPPQLCLTQAPPQLCLTQAPPQLCLTQAPPQLCAFMPLKGSTSPSCTVGGYIQYVQDVRTDYRREISHLWGWSIRFLSVSPRTSSKKPNR